MTDRVLFNGARPDEMRVLSFTLHHQLALELSLECGGETKEVNVTLNEATFNEALVAYIKQTQDTTYGFIGPHRSAETTPEKRRLFAEVLVGHFMSCLRLVMTNSENRLAKYALYYLACLKSQMWPYSDLVQEKVCSFILKAEMMRVPTDFGVTFWRPKTPGSEPAGMKTEIE